MPNTISCAHGSLKRSCYICELEASCAAHVAREKELEEVVKRGCSCICHKYPEHFPFRLFDDIPATIRGHKSHWQEPLDKFERDQLLEGVALHVEYLLKGVRK